MPDDRAPLTRLAEALNEEDPLARAKLLETTWSPGATLTIDGEVVATGLAELDARVTKWLDDPKAWIRLLSRRETDDGEAGRWRVVGDRVAPTTFDLVARVDDRARVAALTATRTDASAPEGGVAQRLGETLLSNPIAATGIVGGAFYLALRLPVGLFYGQLGVAPDEIGIGPEALVPQSLTLVASFLLVIAVFLATVWIARRGLLRLMALEWFGKHEDPPLARRARRTAHMVLVAAAAAAVAVPIALGWSSLSGAWGLGAAGLVIVWFMAVLQGTMAGLARRRPAVGAWGQRLEGQLRRRLGPRDLLRLITLLIALYGLTLLLLLPFWALGHASNVQAGGVAGGRIMPWRAQPVSLHWTKKEHVALTNDCKALRLLGTGNGQLVLYDTELDKLFRVPVADASASVDRDCV